MKSLFSPKLLAAAAIALGAAGAASAAHARSDIVFTVGVQPGYYAQPAPVYVQPRPVYVSPQPVYGVYGYDEGRDWRRDRWDHRDGGRYARRFGPYGDLDHDGIRNRDDRDRDGDGVPNRFDRFPDNPYRR